MNCFRCGAELAWQNDEMLCDVSSFHEDDDEAVVSFYHCPKCGASYEIADCPKEERPNYEYWKKQNEHQP